MSLRLEIVAAEKTLFVDRVDSLVAPGVEGQLGILPKHATLITILQSGELRYRIDQVDQRLQIDGGFLDIQADHVTALVDLPIT